MIAWLKQLRNHVTNLDVDHLLWRTRLEHIVYELNSLVDHHNTRVYDTVRRELVDHIAYGLHRGFIPYNLVKSNKKLLKIK